MTLVNEEHADHDQPLYRSQGGHATRLSQSEDSESWHTICESEEIEEIPGTASAICPAEELTVVHLTNEDIGHDPCGAQ